MQDKISSPTSRLVGSGWQRRAAIGSIVLVATLCWQMPAQSQTIAWPTQTLRPPGTNVTAPVLSSDAVSGDLAMTAYAGNAAQGYRVFVRMHQANSWSPAQLLTQGNDAADNAVTLSADAQRLAIGSSHSANGGQVAIYAHGTSPTGWVLEQTLTAPAGAVDFGKTVSLRGNLIVVTSSQNNGAVYSYRDMDGTGVWVDAGFQFESGMFGAVSAVTDGERIAYCRPLSFSGCEVVAFTDESGWQTESRPRSDDYQDGPVMGLDSTHIFLRNVAGLVIYSGANDEWELSQKIPFTPAAFSLDGANMMAATSQTTHFFSRDGLGQWLESAPVSLGASAAAVQGNLALSSSQSFQHVGAEWVPAGAVAGLLDLSDSYFGSVEVVDDELWIGASGYDSSDLSAGSVWIYPQMGAGIAPTTPSLSPVTPSLQDFFGSQIVSDSGRVAVTSTGRKTAVGGIGRISIFDSATRTLQQTIDVPDAGSTLRSIALAADTLAVSRQVACSGTCSSDVLIYRHNGSSFVLAQAIPFPAGASGGAQFATTLRLQGDWLLSGKLMFKRSGAGDYAYVAGLEKPAGMSWGPTALSRGGDPLVVATWATPERIALVYFFDSASGWSLSGAVKDAGQSLSSDCLSVDVSVQGIGCVAASASGEKLFLAIPDLVGSDWSLIGSSAPLTENPVPIGHYSMRMIGDQAIIGRANTIAEPAGTNVGKVSILSFDETIFTSGFD